jgi:hypothetical protein
MTERKMLTVCLTIALATMMAPPILAETAGIDVPLTVQETAGIDRQQWPVTTGVPLPKGVLKSTEKLQILDAQGRFIPARFAVASRSPEDGSIQWVHCDFAATVRAHEKVMFFLRDLVPLPDFPSPIGFIPRGKEFEVITGPLRFVLGGNSNQLLDQVWVDENWGYDFTAKTKILESGNFDLVLTSAGRAYRTSDWTHSHIEVEEYNPLRAVLKIAGSFVIAERKEARLEYVARLTVFGGKTYFKLEFTLLNRDSASTQASIPIDDLQMSLRLNLDLTDQRFAFGGAPSDHLGTFANAPSASLAQKSAEQYVLTGAIQGGGLRKDGQSANLGWVDLSDGELGLSVAVKWFWQLYPKAFEVRKDGRLIVKLFPSADAPAQVLLPGTARTHEILFHFHGKRHFASGQVKKVLQGFQEPLRAVAPALWYCGDTRVFGRLEAQPAELTSETGSLAANLDAWLGKSRDAYLAARGRASSGEDTDWDGYGVFRFANTRKLRKSNDHIQQNQDGPRVVGDMAHALYLHFFRTGDLRSLELAEELLAQTADFAMAGESVSKPASPDAVAAVEGLFDSFVFTGNRRHLDSARSLLAPLLREHSLSLVESTAEIASALLGLLRGYEVTSDRRWLNASIPLMEALSAWQDGDVDKLRQAFPQLARRWKESFIGSLGESTWDSAMVWQACLRYHELTKDQTVFSRIERSWEKIVRDPQEWNPDLGQFSKSPSIEIVLAPALAALSEVTGNDKYRALARKFFQASIQSADAVAEPAAFGLYFTAGQQFLGYFSQEPQSNRKRDVSSLPPSLKAVDLR